MIYLARPTQSEVQKFLNRQEHSNYSYSPVGLLNDSPPTGFSFDHTREKIGNSYEEFQLAIEAIKNWTHFQLSWVEPCDPDAPIVIGQIVGIQAHCFGVWFLNACRILSVIEFSEGCHKFGFTYGTLEEHAESGEEQFLIEWSPDDKTVWYDIRAYSRPQKWYTKLGYPVTRSVQKRFAKESVSSMRKWIQRKSSATENTGQLR